MILRSFCRFKVYSSRFSCGKKMSQVAIDSKNESMRSFLSGFNGIVRIIGKEAVVYCRYLIRRDMRSKRCFKFMLYKLITCEMRDARCLM
jgi:hypothetical protein